MFDASQSILFRHNTDVFCEPIEMVYNKFNSEKIYVSTTDSVTWRPVKIISHVVFNADSLVDRIHYTNGTDVITDNATKFECSEKASHSQINTQPFFTLIDEQRNYAQGFFVGMYMRGGFYKEKSREFGKFGLQTNEVTEEVSNFIKLQISKIPNLFNVTDLLVSCTSRKDRLPVGSHEIIINDLSPFKTFVNQFITDGIPNLNTILYNENFRRGVLDGIRLFDHGDDTNFSLAVIRNSEEWMVDLVQSLAVSLGYTISIEPQYKSSKCSIENFDIDYGLLPINRIIKQTPTNEFDYSIKPDGEQIEGAVILPNGVLCYDFEKDDA